MLSPIFISPEESYAINTNQLLVFLVTLKGGSNVVRGFLLGKAKKKTRKGRKIVQGYIVVLMQLFDRRLVLQIWNKQRDYLVTWKRFCSRHCFNPSSCENPQKLTWIQFLIKSARLTEKCAKNSYSRINSEPQWWLEGVCQGCIVNMESLRTTFVRYKVEVLFEMYQLI